MSSVSSLRCWGSHVFPVFLEMLGKSGLPCLLHLPQPFGEDMSSPSSPEMLGKTCLPCLPRDVGEDIWGCWGRHSEMLGKTGTLGKTHKAIGEDIKEDGDHTGEVRDDGEDIRDDGEDIGEVREDEEDIGEVGEDIGDNGDNIGEVREAVQDIGDNGDDIGEVRKAGEDTRG